METREHWWNGLWGTMNRRDIWLRFNPQGPLWEIEARQSGQHAMREFVSEREARAVLAELTSLGPGKWKRLSA